MMNDSDQALFRNNGETGINEMDISCSFSEGKETVAIFKDTSVSVPYQVSSGLKSSLDEEQSRSCNNGSGSANNSEHSQVPVIDKECDHNTARDIWVNEGVSSLNKNSLVSLENFELEKKKCFYSTQEKAIDVPLEVSSKRVACQPDGNNFLDFDSLLELAEMGNNQTQVMFDHTGDKSYLDELLASASNPFLEDLTSETFQGDKKQAVNIAHPSNPFNFDGTLYESEGNTSNSTGPDETSNKFSAKSDVTEEVFSSKNPFLDTSSFKLAMDDFKNAEKISGNDVTVEGVVKKETPARDGQADVPSITSTVSSQEPSDKMKVPEQCNSPPANGSQLQHEPLESSFASMNPYPALISYSGQIPFSGSMSRRSESSATSNRSFAFPVLQTEWKASPVRMAKADRKHNSWKQNLLCCNF